MKTYIWLYLLGVVLGIVLGFVWCDVAHAKTATIKTATIKTKAASTRVAEAFRVYEDLKPLAPQRVSPAPQRVWIKPVPRYIANRPSFFVAGKLMIYRECEVDLSQDPGEHSCKPVWAWL